jgi:3-phenylpropionate/trans-cinnamate dioxygenase ferredoxin component
MYNYIEFAPAEIEYVAVAGVNELHLNERLYVTIDEAQIIVLNLAGQYYAIGDVCSHDGNVLDDAPVDGYEVVCPRHGARFDIRNGKATSLPAVVGIPAYPVRIREGQIEVGVPKQK